MKSVLESSKDCGVLDGPPENDLARRLAVLQELDRILSSRHFKCADRCKQFLHYVVLNRLEDQTDRLKERTIGTEVFQRPPGYSTGDDPVVRVQAGEVRRRLDQYYQEMPQLSPVRIELPVGSYSPVFHWVSPEAKETLGNTASQGLLLRARGTRRLKGIFFAVAAVLAGFGGAILIHSTLRTANSEHLLESFWGPALASHQPILIYLANASDHPAEEISPPSSQASSGVSQDGVKAIRTSLPIAPNASPAGNDASVSPEIVPAADASVAIALSGLFGKLNKPAQLRIGATGTFVDLRDFPAAVIGGFNNKWTMQLMSNLHFAFLQIHEQYMIREQAPNGKVWTTQLGSHGETVEDFAIVARLIDSKTGQFTVTIAGIGPRGTEAAGEFVSSPRFLEEGLAGAPAGWQDHDLEVLLQTTVTDSIAGPPHVIGIFTW